MSSVIDSSLSLFLLLFLSLCLSFFLILSLFIFFCLSLSNSLFHSYSLSLSPSLHLSLSLSLSGIVESRRNLKSQKGFYTVMVSGCMPSGTKEKAGASKHRPLSGPLDHFFPVHPQLAIKLNTHNSFLISIFLFFCFLYLFFILSVYYSTSLIIQIIFMKLFQKSFMIIVKERQSARVIIRIMYISKSTSRHIHRNVMRSRWYFGGKRDFIPFPSRATHTVLIFVFQKSTADITVSITEVHTNQHERQKKVKQKHRQKFSILQFSSRINLLEMKPKCSDSLCHINENYIILHHII